MSDVSPSLEKTPRERCEAAVDLALLRLRYMGRRVDLPLDITNLVYLTIDQLEELLPEKRRA